MEKTIENIKRGMEESKRDSLPTEMSKPIAGDRNLTLMAVREHGQPYMENSGMGSIRHLIPKSDSLLWTASGEIINTTTGQLEPNLLNTSIGTYATVNTNDGKSFYSNTPVSNSPGMKGTTINNGLGGPTIEGFSTTPDPPFPKKVMTRMAIFQHGQPYKN